VVGKHAFLLGLLLELGSQEQKICDEHVIRVNHHDDPDFGALASEVCTRVIQQSLESGHLNRATDASERMGIRLWWSKRI
jgi:hypothetical protein